MHILTQSDLDKKPREIEGDSRDEHIKWIGKKSIKIRIVLIIILYSNQNYDVMIQFFIFKLNYITYD